MLIAPNAKLQMMCFARFSQFDGVQFWIVLFIITAILSEYEKRLLLRCMHHFKSDLINNMDHMRISGTEPSSVILSKTK